MLIDQVRGYDNTGAGKEKVAGVFKIQKGTERCHKQPAYWIRKTFLGRFALL
jgi:hypothetical protein